MTEQQKIEKLEAVLGMLLLAFPNETVEAGHRVRSAEARRLNSAIVAGKEYVALRNKGGACGATREELLEALRAVVDYGSMTGDDWVAEKVSVAIAKAEGRS